MYTVDSPVMVDLPMGKHIYIYIYTDIHENNL